MINNFEDKNLYTHGQTYCRLYEIGSFSGVAKKFGISQSTVSRRIAALEKFVAKVLIKRNTRSVEFTNDGKRFYEFFTQHENNFDDTIRTFINENQEKKVTLKISIPYGTANIILTPKIPEYLALHPNITLQMKNQTRIVDLNREDYDIVIQRQRPSNKKYKATVLPVPYLYAYCTQKYIDKYGEPKTIEDTLNRFIIGAIAPENPNLKELGGLNSKNEIEFFDTDHRLSISNIEPNALFIESNEVIALSIDEMYKEGLADKSIVKVLTDYKFLNYPLYMIVNPESKHPLVMDFANHITNLFRVYSNNQFAQ